MWRHVGRGVGLGVVLAIGLALDAARALAGFGAPLISPFAPTPRGSSVAPHEDAAGPVGRSDRRDALPAEGDDFAPAVRYGRLDQTACEIELARRGSAFTHVEGARGVLQPLRLTGPLHGVTFHSTEPLARRASTPWEIVDCRLALALDDFAAQLAAHDVVEVVHYSIYRPPATEWPAERVGSRHEGALAIDAAVFRKKDGTQLDVEHDFHGQLGVPPCGPGAGPSPATSQAVELRQIVCDAAEAKLFNVALTPDYNRAHYNHFHLEVAAGVKWFVVR